MDNPLRTTPLSGRNAWSGQPEDDPSSGGIDARSIAKKVSAAGLVFLAAGAASVAQGAIRRRRRGTR